MVFTALPGRPVLPRVLGDAGVGEESLQQVVAGDVPGGDPAGELYQDGRAAVAEAFGLGPEVPS